MGLNDLSISVIIITRNRSESLQDTLTSLTRQTRQPDEVVVVDNASEDNTRETIMSFKDKLNIQYVHESKRGIPYARNAGIRCASGDIISSIDDDCIADEDWLKNIERPFIKDPNIGIVGGEVSYFKIGGSSIENFYIKNMTARKKSENSP